MRRSRFAPSGANDEPSDSELSEAVEEEVFEDGVREEEEEEDGEDLLGDGFEADYAPNPELDRYDETMLDQEEYTADYRARVSAERALNRRDLAQGRRLPEAVLSESDDDDAGGRRQRRRLERLQESEEMTEAVDEDEINLNGEEIRADTDLLNDERLRGKIKKSFREFLRTYIDPKWDSEEPAYLDRIDSMAAENGSTLPVVFEPDLLQWSPMLAQWVADYPSKVLPVLHETALKLTKERYEGYKANNREVFVRIEGFPVKDHIRDLRGFHMNRLVNISGVITKRTSVMPCLRLLYLDCLRCGYLVGPKEVNASDGSTDVNPGSCPECQGRGPFSVNRDETVYRNFQRVVVQETPGSVPAGRMPRSKEVTLTSDLVDSVRPGDQVEVVGVFKSKLDGLSNIKNGFPVFKSHIEANSIRRRNELKMGSLGEEDKREILALAKESNVRERIIHSIAPSIFGEKHMKTCVAMAMFGGRQKMVAGKHRIRGDINVLILGDPGMAKSQCLKYVEKTFHRTVYTTGKGASAVGLTASVRKDNLTGEYVLEGGAMVLADSGICLIDEFDKMNDQDRTSIHEAMEQQSISISKAGIVTSLSSRCAVIAAANPIGGRYDTQLTFAENVDLTDPILSRFDCLCVLKDDIDIFKDEALADFVVCSHMKNHPTEPNETVRPRRRLNNDNSSQIKPIDQDLLKKYLLYSRLHVNPTISEVDQNKLARFYTEIRREAAASQGVAMTVRHMESMIRMAEANARMELRDYVMDKDVDFGIATMLETFIQTQKHSVAERMRRKFEAAYITSVTAHSDLIHFLLRKMFRKKLDYHALVFQAESGDAEEVVVTVQELFSEAKKMDIITIDDYLSSEAFLDAFDMREGVIHRKNKD